MSEHIRPASDPYHSPVAQATERTPGVLHEKGDFNFRLVLWVGFGLIVTVVLVHLAVWRLLFHEEERNIPPSGGQSSPMLADARRPLEQRLLDVPPPLLEGLERESSLLILRTGDAEERKFYVASDVRVRIGDKEKARLFELREGQTVDVTYHMPDSVISGLGVVTSITSLPVKSRVEAAHEWPDTARTLTAAVVKIEPRGIEAAREWAEVQMDRYGWVDRQKSVARIPITTAMEEILHSREFPKKAKGTSNVRLPSRSNSGQSEGREKP
jgi:hypothetical protein